jgi:hypothetical protein
MMHRILRLVTKGVGICLAGAAAGYGLLVAGTWLRYGHAPQPALDDADSLLDHFVPRYDIVERHHVRVAAPADLTLVAAAEMDLQESLVVRGIFKCRELLLGADAESETRPRGLLALTKHLGWGVLAETPGREIVMGAVTQPWNANVVFRALPPAEFAAFNEPDYVKIVWTLRADPITGTESMSRTETRAVATGPDARRKFRRYWAFVAPGVALIRCMSMGIVKRDAERRFRERPAVAAPLERGT